MDDGKEPIYDDESERDLNEEYCDVDCGAKSLVIQRVMTVQEDEKWLRQYFQNLLCFF